jgi:hypothetical protein
VIKINGDAEDWNTEKMKALSLVDQFLAYGYKIVVYVQGKSRRVCKLRKEQILKLFVGSKRPRFVFHVQFCDWNKLAIGAFLAGVQEYPKSKYIQLSDDDFGPLKINKAILNESWLSPFVRAICQNGSGKEWKNISSIDATVRMQIDWQNQVEALGLQVSGIPSQRSGEMGVDVKSRFPGTLITIKNEEGIIRKIFMEIFDLSVSRQFENKLIPFTCWKNELKYQLIPHVYGFGESKSQYRDAIQQRLDFDNIRREVDSWNCDKYHFRVPKNLEVKKAKTSLDGVVCHAPGCERPAFILKKAGFGPVCNAHNARIGRGETGEKLYRKVRPRSPNGIRIS